MNTDIRTERFYDADGNLMHTRVTSDEYRRELAKILENPPPLPAIPKLPPGVLIPFLRIGDDKMNIKAEWIPISEQLPEHGTHCIVGNANERDPENPNLGTRWQSAIYRDSSHDDDLPGFIFKCKFEAVTGFFIPDQLALRPVEAFTHWWPIPKPFK